MGSFCIVFTARYSSILFNVYKNAKGCCIITSFTVCSIISSYTITSVTIYLVSATATVLTGTCGAFINIYQMSFIITVIEYVIYSILVLVTMPQNGFNKCTKKLQKQLHFYHFRNWVHHIHQRKCKCDHLLCLCNFLRFDKGLKHIRQYLKKV